MTSSRHAANRNYAHAMLSTLVIVPPADVEEMAASRKLWAERLRTGCHRLYAELAATVCPGGEEHAA